MDTITSGNAPQQAVKQDSIMQNTICYCYLFSGQDFSLDMGRESVSVSHTKLQRITPYSAELHRSRSICAEKRN